MLPAAGIITVAAVIGANTLINKYVYFDSPGFPGEIALESPSYTWASLQQPDDLSASLSLTGASSSVADLPPVDFQF